MDAWLTGLFERHGTRYVRWYLVALVLEVLLILVPAVSIFPSRYEGLSVGQFLVVLAVADGVALLVFTGVFVVLRRQIRDLLAWITEPLAERLAAARRAAFAGPRRAAQLSIAFGIVLVPTLVAVLAVPSHHTTTLDLLELAIGASAAVGGVALNTQFTLEVMMRPIRAALPSAPDVEQRATSLVVRIALAVPALTWVGGSAVGFLGTTRAAAGAGHILVVFGIAVAITAVCLTLIVPLLTSGLANPIGDLIRATRAVAGGRLDLRVPVTTTDELGELGASFNHMIDELQDSRARIVAASDAARRKVERDLHDGAQQRLVLLKLKLGMLERDPGRHGLIEELRDELENAIVEVRNLARGIYPPRLESEGLPGALSDATGQAAIPAALDCDGAGRYRPELETAVYFCCLEALQNAAKHAGQGAKAHVRLTETYGELRFEVADDGRGFDLAKLGVSSGLQNMADRIGALGGKLVVQSAPGGGTTVRGEVPISE